MGGLSAGGTRSLEQLQRFSLLTSLLGLQELCCSSSFPGRLVMRSALGAGMAEERSPVGGFQALALGDVMSEHPQEHRELSTAKAAQAFPGLHWRFHPLHERAL